MGELTKKIHETIEVLSTAKINGCITGSSMIPDADFDTWESIPDIDIFVYTEAQLPTVAALLQYKYGFQPATAGEEWKLDRVENFGIQRNAPLSTLKFENDGIIINVTYKKNRNNLFSVLSSFDMSIIMIGMDIPSGTVLDLRCAWPGMVRRDPKSIWSYDIHTAVPNPLRKQDVDMYGAEMWIRQFDRVIKYWNRGFDTRPMAEFYIRLIDGVINTGQLFHTDKSERAYQEFITAYEPLKDKMVQWLEDRKEL